MPAWFIQLLVAIVFTIVAYIIMPKPKTPKPAAATDMEAPTAEGGRPVPVIFGTITIRGTNILWWGDKSLREYEVEA